MSSNSKVPFTRKGARSSWDYKTQFKYGLYDTGACGLLTQVYSYFDGSESLKAASFKATHARGLPGSEQAVPAPDSLPDPASRRQSYMPAKLAREVPRLVT